MVMIHRNDIKHRRKNGSTIRKIKKNAKENHIEATIRRIIYYQRGKRLPTQQSQNVYMKRSRTKSSLITRDCRVVQILEFSYGLLLSE
jgi:hypothetical protein